MARLNAYFCSCDKPGVQEQRYTPITSRVDGQYIILTFMVDDRETTLKLDRHEVYAIRCASDHFSFTSDPGRTEPL